MKVPFKYEIAEEVLLQDDWELPLSELTVINRRVRFVREVGDYVNEYLATTKFDGDQVFQEHQLRKKNVGTKE